MNPTGKGFLLPWWMVDWVQKEESCGNTWETLLKLHGYMYQDDLQGTSSRTYFYWLYGNAPSASVWQVENPPQVVLPIYLHSSQMIRFGFPTNHPEWCIQISSCSREGVKGKVSGLTSSWQEILFSNPLAVWCLMMETMSNSGWALFVCRVSLHCSSYYIALQLPDYRSIPPLTTSTLILVVASHPFPTPNTSLYIKDFNKNRMNEFLKMS